MNQSYYTEHMFKMQRAIFLNIARAKAMIRKNHGFFPISGRSQKHLAPGLPDIGQVLANDPLVNQLGRHRRQLQITCNLY